MSNVDWSRIRMAMRVHLAVIYDAHFRIFIVGNQFQRDIAHRAGRAAARAPCEGLGSVASAVLHRDRSPLSTCSNCGTLSGHELLNQRLRNQESPRSDAKAASRSSRGFGGQLSRSFKPAECATQCGGIGVAGIV